MMIVLGLESRCGYVILLMAVYWVTEALPLPITALLPGMWILKNCSLNNNSKKTTFFTVVRTGSIPITLLAYISKDYTCHTERRKNMGEGSGSLRLLDG
jgi:hypothetical protein